MKFNDYFLSVQEKAGQRMDRDSVRYFYDHLVRIMDCVIVLTYRRP